MPGVTNSDEVQESLGFMFNDIVWAVDIPEAVQANISDFDTFISTFWECINNALDEGKSDTTQDLHCIKIIEGAKRRLAERTGIVLGEVRAVYSICSITAKTM